MKKSILSDTFKVKIFIARRLNTVQSIIFEPELTTVSEKEIIQFLTFQDVHERKVRKILQQVY